MKFKKILALILCTAILFTLATACKKTDDTQPSGNETVTDNNDNSENGSTPGEIDFAGAYTAFKPEEVMLTVGGLDVTWDLLYYFISRAIEEVIYTTGEVPDLSIEGDQETGSLGFKEQIMTRAIESVIIYKAIEYGAQQNGVTLTDDDLASIALDRQLAAEQLGGEEALMETLTNEEHMSNEVYTYLLGMSYLHSGTMAALYGSDGSGVTDAQVEASIAGEDWLMAKHLLILTGDKEEGEALALAEDILAQVEAYNGDDFDAFFSDLIVQYGEDPGAVAKPGGYIFTGGDMVPEFEQGTRDLEFGGVSGLVQTDYGYHIIYRLPVNYDEVPTNWQGGTLRLSVAYELLQINIEEWQQEVAIEYSANYENLDIAKIY